MPVPAVTLAHASVAPHDLWRAWPFEPVLLVVLPLAAWAYGTGVGSLWARGRGRGIRLPQALAFYGALLALAVALLSPLGALAETLFSVHMVQHLLLILVAAPLLVYSAPLAPMMLALPRSLRRPLRALERQRTARAVVRALRNLIVVWALHAVTLWAWHLPALYQRAIESEVLHVVEHVSFLATALLFWSLVVQPARRDVSHGAAIFLVFATALQSAALGAILTFASDPLFPVHASGWREWRVSGLADQQLAGLLMWVPPGLLYLVAMAALFLRWMRAMDARMERVDAARPARLGERS